jgi:hypothetical protein
MVSIYHTANGWEYHVPAKKGYYSTLAEVMDAAYAAEDWAANNNAVSAVRNSPCDNCRFAAGG